MNTDEISKYWIETSDNDYRTMTNLVNSKDYAWALFIGHLVIEKLLKACYIKLKDQNIPRVHDLLRLAVKSGLDIDPQKMNILDEITTFNIKARYDDYKLSFVKLCTYKFTQEKIDMINEIREWLKKVLES